MLNCLLQAKVASTDTSEVKRVKKKFKSLTGLTSKTARSPKSNYLKKFWEETPVISVIEQLSAEDGVTPRRGPDE